MALSVVKREENDINIEEIRIKLQEYIDRTGKSQSAIAKAIGVSSATISQFLRGVYTGDNEQLAFAVSKLLDLDTRRQSTVKQPEFAMTSVAEDVLAVAKFAHDHCDIGVTYGPAGIGKTMALKKYAEDNPGTVFITASVCISSPKAILEELADKLGKQEYGDKRRLQRSIIPVIKSSGRLVIIDEAQHLSYRALEALRSIYDECKIGLVLCGNDQVYINMIGKRNAPFAQLFSRVGVRRALTGKLSLEDVKKIVCQNTDVPKDCLEFFHRMANAPGGLRLMVKLFVLAWTVGNDLGRPIDMSIVSKAREFLMQQPCE